MLTDLSSHVGSCHIFILSNSLATINSSFMHWNILVVVNISGSKSWRNYLSRDGAENEVTN